MKAPGGAFNASPTRVIVRQLVQVDKRHEMTDGVVGRYLCPNGLAVLHAHWCRSSSQPVDEPKIVCSP